MILSMKLKVLEKSNKKFSITSLIFCLLIQLNIFSIKLLNKKIDHSESFTKSLKIKLVKFSLEIDDLYSKIQTIFEFLSM